MTESDLNAPLVTNENRLQHLMRNGKAAPRFLQGVFPFAGRGVFDLTPLNDALVYLVPDGKTAQVLYFRAGNHSDDLLYFTLTANEIPIRYFPIGPKSDLHVPLVITETHPAGTRLEIGIAAARGVSGTLIVDVGIVEINAEE